MHYRHTSALARLGATALITAALGLAQAPPQMFRVAYTKLQPGGAPVYQAAAKMAVAASKKAGIPWREVWNINIAGDAGYVSVTPIQSYATFDSPAAMTAAMSESERMQYQQLTSKAIASSRYVVMQQAPDLSISSGSNVTPKVARVVEVVALPGKQLEFEDLIKNTLIPAYKKAGIKDMWTSRHMVGAPLGSYTILLLVDKYADLDKLPTTQVLLGGEAAFKAYLAKVATCVASTETSFARYMPELSYHPAQ